MSTEWKVSARAARLIETGIAHYISSVGKPHFDFCPAILWSPGGELQTANGKKIRTVAPEYGLNVIARKDIAEQRFVSISVPGVGTVGFKPNGEDLASDRRLIDLDGKHIVVR